MLPSNSGKPSAPEAPSSSTSSSPRPPEHDKQGLDDYVVAGGNLGDCIANAVDHLPEPPELRHKHDVDDFYAFGPTGDYLFVPTGDIWKRASVARMVAPVAGPGGNSIPAPLWLDERRRVDARVWAPGEPHIIADRIPRETGWFEQAGLRTYNDYRPPLTLEEGNAACAGPWLEHLQQLYPDDWEHLLCWFAQRVQDPGTKINHALVLGGRPGIGKDTVLHPVLVAVGPGNYAEVSPTQLVGRFNSFLQCVILKVSEARDMGEGNRFAFHDHTKTFATAPPYFIRVDEKYEKARHIANVVGLVYTTNHQFGGLYLPTDDRRHYVCWSDVTAAALGSAYFKRLWSWLEAEGGNAHVAAYLRSVDLSHFDPKTEPQKTDAFWAMVESHRSTEEDLLADLIEEVGSPDVLTIDMLVQKTTDPNGSMFHRMVDTMSFNEFGEILQGPQARKQVKHWLNRAGYIAVQNPHSQSEKSDGRWKVAGKNTRLYAKSSLRQDERLAAVRAFIQDADRGGKVHKKGR